MRASVEKMLAEARHPSRPTHFAIELVNLFEVDTPRNRAYDRAGFGTSRNRRLLWHGSGLANWCGILSEGLRIAPPNAPVSGYNFDKGIYFTNAA